MSKITFNECFSLIYDFVARRRKTVIAFVVFLTIASGVGIFFVTFDNDVKFMLPDKSLLRRSIKFLDSSRVTNNVVVSIELTSPEYPLNKLTDAAKELAASIDSPLITGVKDIASGSEMSQDANRLIAYAPQLFDETDEGRLVEQTSPDKIKKRISQIYRQTLMPGGSFMASMMLADPFGMSLKVFDAMEKLSVTLGYDVVFEDGVMLNRDRSHAMIILETQVPVTDSFGSRRLIEYVQEKISLLPDYVSADIVSGHLHAIDNEIILKRDIKLVSLTVLIAFFYSFYMCIQRLWDYYNIFNAFGIGSYGLSV